MLLNLVYDLLFRMATGVTGGAHLTIDKFNTNLRYGKKIFPQSRNFCRFFELAGDCSGFPGLIAGGVGQIKNNKTNKTNKTNRADRGIGLSVNETIGQ